MLVPEPLKDGCKRVVTSDEVGKLFNGDNRILSSKSVEQRISLWAQIF